MPNDTYFLRDANLYVDIDDYARKWMAPENELRGILFKVAQASDGWAPSPLDEANQALADLRDSQDSDLLRPDALRILSGVMESIAVSEKSTRAGLSAALERSGKRLEQELVITQQKFSNSPLFNWPLYWIKIDNKHA